MASTPNSLGELHPPFSLNALAQEWVQDEDCTLLRSCSGRHQCGPYEDSQIIGVEDCSH